MASAVLALVLALLLQIISSVTASTRTQNRQMESVGAARRALDVMSSDLKSAVIGENVSILVPVSDGDGYLFALLANRRSPAGSPGRFLAVSYSYDSSGDQLFRTYAPVDYGVADLFAPIGQVISAARTTPLLTNILAVQLLADLNPGSAAATSLSALPLPAPASPNWASNGTYNGFTVPAGNAIVTASRDFAAGSPTGTDPVPRLPNTTRALEIWIAATDPKTYGILTNTSTLSVVKSALAGASSDPSLWRSAVDAAAIPADAKSGIRILNITVPLP